MPVTKNQLLVLKANNEEAHLETITCIRKALINLLQRRHYSEISMTDIIKKSGISRAGVYKNYKNKAEIIFDIYQEPIDEVIRALGTSIFENMEMIFRTGKKHEEAIRTILDAGLEHNLLASMNKRYEGVSVSFYIPLWIGMIYNAFIEWARAGMDEPVEKAVERVTAGLKLVAESIEADLTNRTQNMRL